MSPAPKITPNSKLMNPQSNTDFPSDYGVSEILDTSTWIKRLKHLLSEKNVSFFMTSTDGQFDRIWKSL